MMQIPGDSYTRGERPQSVRKGGITDRFGKRVSKMFNKLKGVYVAILFSFLPPLSKLLCRKPLRRVIWDEFAT